MLIVLLVLCVWVTYQVPPILIITYKCDNIVITWEKLKKINTSKELALYVPC